MRDAEVLRRLLADNRAWLEPWEASFPGGGGEAPGSVSMRPVVRAMRAQQRMGSAVTFVITYAGDDAGQSASASASASPDVVGQLTVSDISGGAMRSASIGYWVAEGVAGRGITPAAVALAIDYCFFDLRLHRVEICIRPENTASLRVVEKLGLRYEGRRARYIHIGDDWCDHDCFAITAEEVPRGIVARL